MRNRTSFFSLAAVAAGLLAATPARAAGELPTTCTTSEFVEGTAYTVTPPWVIELVGGPTAVPCSSPDGCTEVEYKVSGSTKPSSVTVLTGLGLKYITGYDTELSAPCEGEDRSEAGEFSCHEQAARTKGETPPFTFKVGVEGSRELGLTSVIVRKSDGYGACAIAGLTGEAVNPFQTVTRTEVLRFKDCHLQFDYDADGDPVGTPFFVPPSAPGCDLTVKSVDDLELILDGSSLGLAQIGDGIISSGSASCTTRVIGRTVYTWGDPCP